jgi:hypothetical protein
VLTLALFTAVFCFSQTSAWCQDQPAPPAGRTLKVTVKYTGVGTVDDAHKLFLFVFDTPDIQSGPMPIGASSTNKNESVVTFENLSTSPIYVAAVFDSSGTYDGMSNPPSGSPAALYMIEQPGVATPVKIEPGQTGEIEFVFDDSFKMP